jgi:HlyD family secretion protein
MKKGIPALIVVFLLAGIGWWFLSAQPTENGRGIFISGNVEATEVDLAFRIAGQISRFPVSEGDRVQVDEVIAELDTDTLLAMKGAAQAEIAAAHAVLDELQEGTRKEEIEIARAVLKATESRLTNARSEFDRYQPLFKGGAVSKSLFDAKEMALKVAVAEFNRASERLRELELGPRVQRIRAARARLERATWELKRIELDLKHSVLTTPISGVVLTKSNETGEIVLPGATVATVAEIGQVWLKGYVAENRLGLLKLGQTAEVTTDTFPGKLYRGEVTFVSSRAEFTPKNVQTREERIKQVYRVKVTIPNPSQELKIGMPAEGYILVGEGTASARSRSAGTGGVSESPGGRLRAWYSRIRDSIVGD